MTRHTHSRRGFSLVELLVVIGIIALLIGILMPTLSAVRKSAYRTRCQAALRDIGMRYRMYLDDAKDFLPFVNTMPSLQPPLNTYPAIVQVIEPYRQDADLSFTCPADYIMTADAGAPAGFERYFDREGSSYEYNPLLGNLPWAGKRINEFKASTIGQTMFPGGKPTLLWVLKDYAPFHGKANTRGAMNYLFWDMRIGDIADEVTQ